MFDKVIFLIKYVDSGEKDEYGDPVLTEDREMRFAKEVSIGMKEFYQAQGTGLKPEIKFALSDYLDYDGQLYVEYNKTLYNTMRTYNTKTNKLELTCYGGIRK